MIYKDLEFIKTRLSMVRNFAFDIKIELLKKNPNLSWIKQSVNDIIIYSWDNYMQEIFTPLKEVTNVNKRNRNRILERKR